MKLKHYLIPTEQNDYRPWITSTQALAVFCLTIWALRVLLPNVTRASAAIDPTDLMNKINYERTQRFVTALNTNSKLITAAQGKANDMLARSYFSHVDPDGNYVWPRIEAAGYTPYLTLGENLAMDFTSADAMIAAWMNSPTHRENILNDKFQDQGLATVAGTYEPAHDTIIAVSLFGTLYKSTSSAANQTPTASKPKAFVPPSKSTSPKTAVPSSTLKISQDIKINSTALSGHTMVNIDAVIAGSPTLVTAQLKTQSITMIAGKTLGEFIGSFTFDPTEDLANQTLTVEARDKTGAKITANFPVNIQAAGVSGDQKINVPIAVANETQVIRILRIIFGIFAAIYMIFLIIDAIIVHRAKINRPGIRTSTHALVFLLIASVMLFSKWF